MKMTPKQYELISHHFQEVVILNSPQQLEYLENLRREHPEAAEQVSRMIEADLAANDRKFMEAESSKELPQTIGYEADDATETAHPAKRLGQYELREKLGEGGMGVVYRAFHGPSEREVALKLIRSNEFASNEEIERFRAESKIAANMQHPHIVRVYEVGQIDGKDVFTMALIDGHDLRSVLRSRKLSSRESAEIILKVAEALEYAHRQGVVHRDIKPGNILIDQQGEPHVTDFGIAKRLSTTESQTSTGQLLGSLNYMAPEQINDPRCVSGATDVYSLGATLYECLTGQPPFAGESAVEVLNQARTSLPPRVTDRFPHIERDLERICFRCLQKDPSERYKSAGELCQDLRRFLDGEPLVGTRDGWWNSTVRIFRHRERALDFSSAGAATWVFALTLVLHPIVFFLIWTRQQHIWLWLTLAIWACTACLTNYRFNWSSYWRLAPRERQSGIIQLSVIAAFIVLFFIHGPLSTSDPITNFLAVYPPFCLICGVGVCAHGGFHAGRWLLLGGVYFPLAILIHLVPDFGPLMFALVSVPFAAMIDRELKQMKLETGEPRP